MRARYQSQLTYLNYHPNKILKILTKIIKIFLKYYIYIYNADHKNKKHLNMALFLCSSLVIYIGLKLALEKNFIFRL